MRTLLRTPKGTHEGYAEGTQKSLRTGTQKGYANAKKVRTLSGQLVHINHRPLARLSSDSLYYLQFCNKLKCDKSELIGLDDFSQGHFRIPETGIRVFILS